jgi:hypothetical protein
MTTTMELNDQELLQQYKDGSLSPELFTHETQLKLSWILINRYGLELATKKNCQLKENYYLNTLKSKKFNLPLTKSYTEILHHFMEKTPTKNFDKLLREFPRLKYNFKELVKTHYGYDILKEHRNEDIKPNPNRPILFTF